MIDHMSSVKIYVVSHKNFSYPRIKNYQVIQVGFGAALPNAERDNTGEQISEKNKTFCELTALYWIWKNDADSKYIGLCHYRRYFTKNMFSTDERYFLQTPDLENILKDYDIIVPKKLYFSTTIWNNYFERGCGREEDLKKLADVILEKNPDDFEIFQQVFQEKSGFYYNMFVMSRKSLDEYCEWLFPILFELEKRVDLSCYTDQEKRIFGYLSEILFNVWIRKKGLKYREISVVNTECTLFKRIRMLGKNYIQKLI